MYYVCIAYICNELTKAVAEIFSVKMVFAFSLNNI